MREVYLVWHTYETDPFEEQLKLIGVYRTKDDAAAAVGRLRQRPGFCDTSNGFQVVKVTLDRDEWTDGFCIMISDDGTESTLTSSESKKAEPWWKNTPLTTYHVRPAPDGYSIREVFRNGRSLGFQVESILGGTKKDGLTLQEAHSFIDFLQKEEALHPELAVKPVYADDGNLSDRHQRQRGTGWRGKVYILWHDYKAEPFVDGGKLIGVYRAKSDALAAAHRMRAKPGFCETPEDFHIVERNLNEDAWTDGFTVVIDDNQAEPSRDKDRSKYRDLTTFHLRNSPDGYSIAEVFKSGQSLGCDVAIVGQGTVETGLSLEQAHLLVGKMQSISQSGWPPSLEQARALAEHLEREDRSKG